MMHPVVACHVDAPIIAHKETLNRSVVKSMADNKNIFAKQCNIFLVEYSREYLPLNLNRRRNFSQRLMSQH